MTGVVIDILSYIYGDNMSVTKNISKPESILKKKSRNMCYHFVHEAFADKECLASYIPTQENLFDLLTKVMSNFKCCSLVSQVLYAFYDHVKSTE